MMKHNESIGCSVSECKFHCKEDDYCTLDKIKVSRDTETQARESAMTECASFKLQ